MPFQSLERRLLPDTDTLQSVVHNRQQVGTVKEITDIIKTYRKPAASAGAAKEEAKIVEEDEDDDKDDNAVIPKCEGEDEEAKVVGI